VIRNNTACTGERGLDGFLDLAAADAARAGEDAARRAVDERPDGLKIRAKDPLGAVVGVADVVAGRAYLPADFTFPGHDSAPPDCSNEAHATTTGLSLTSAPRA